MKVFKRAWISIIRRKINSLVLLLIVFVLANVLLTTLAVTTSLKNTKEMVLKQFPPTISIDYNYENFNSEKTPKLNVEKIEKLYNQTKDIVKSYDYTLHFSLSNSPSMKYSTIPGALESDIYRIENEYTYFVGTQLSQTSLVAKGEAKLISGRGFREADIKEGKPTLIVSKQFAEANAIEVGSHITMMRKLYDVDTMNGAGITLEEPYFVEDIDFEIVGIMEIDRIEDFLKKQNVDTEQSRNDIQQIQNLADIVYAPNNYISSVIKNNKERVKEHNPDADVVPGVSLNENVYPEFILNDTKDLDTFLEEAKKVYSEKHFTITSAASEYDVVAKPLDSMENLLDLVFKITVLASIVVLSLVLYIFMYLRRKEMGVFLALGERRWKIIGQLLLETLVVASIGATLAIATSLLFSNMLSDNAVTTLLTPTKEINNMITSMNSGYGVTPEVISQQLQGGFGFGTLMVFYGTMTLTIIISQFATVLYLLRLHPKKILL